ncbi:hypothetical protein GCM10017688_35280 [Streptomyces ramulosus]
MSAPGAVLSPSPLPADRPPSLLPQIALAAVCGGYAVGSALGWGSPKAALVMGDFGLSFAALVAAVSCALYARRCDPHTRPAWTLFAGSSAMAALGNGIWGWYEVVEGAPVPSPSPADFCFLLFAPPAIVGLLVLAKRPVTRAGWTCLGLDSWLIGGSLLTLSWSLALANTAHFQGRSVARCALAVAYPLLDIVLVSMVLALHFRRGCAQRSAVNTAIAALALTVLCDALFTSPLLREHYRSGQILDAGWFAGSILLAYAPGSPAAPRGARRRTPHGSRAAPCTPGPGRSPARSVRWRRILPPACAPSASSPTSSTGGAWTAASSSPAARSSSPWSSARASCCSTTSPSPRSWRRRRTTSAPWCRAPATSS